jgi:hypothetical protein
MEVAKPKKPNTAQNQNALKLKSKNLNSLCLLIVEAYFCGSTGTDFLQFDKIAQN